MTSHYIFKHFTGERALFKTHDAHIEHSTFDDGESPLKESDELTISDTTFGWKYPLWYCRNVSLSHSTLLETARSGIWYTHNISIDNSAINAPKTFRKSSHITIANSSIPYADETLWNCSDITMTNVNVRGDYFGMNSSNINLDNVKIDGNYAFDGGKNIVIRNSHLATKDALWNTENVTVYDSVITGEYIGWNSKNLTFINCVIESNQGLCYIDGLTLKNCIVRNTDLAFEYCSDIDAQITSPVLSIKNPINGLIAAPHIDNIIFDDPDIDPSATKIKTNNSLSLKDN
ncbi:DUF3737 family protein [Alloscardovia theropitheci]|uniref:DUF3737 family protein n=1 Tax=Alloscardovia theropitheci TaxID=2496842 RepID=A0A4R0QYW7_9BIFI|nr:DUF3737 family protein [Alloscardovia theropitheci]TCD55050.1 DUF3737 family protein [Alloscardovia theropitheci]